MTERAQSHNHMRTILVVEDDASLSWVLRRGLEQQGHAVVLAEDGEAALEAHASRQPHAVVLDLRLPRLGGLHVLERLKAGGASCPIIVMTAQNTMQNAVDAMKLGAFDYLVKPFDLDDLYHCLERALAGGEAGALVEDDAQTQETAGPQRLIGRSAAMQEVFKVIGRVAARDITVLISGESGSGKELVARALHDNSRRAKAPFVPVNCAAIAPELLESELFGHVRGSFTGAIADRTGKFEQANGGTIFLDEIGDMEPVLQRKILRVLQEREVEPVGGRTSVKVDVRVIAATHKDLEYAVETGEFRGDLYYRLNVVPIQLPPLRDRLDDVPLLAREFVSRAAAELDLEVKALAPQTVQRLQMYSWPGNVRELENVIRRAMVLSSEFAIQPEHVPLAAAWPTLGRDARTPHAAAEKLHDQLYRLVEAALRRSLDDVDAAPQLGLYDELVGQLESCLLSATIEFTRGNQSRAAEILGIHRNTLRKKLAQIERRNKLGRASPG